MEENNIRSGIIIATVGIGLGLVYFLSRARGVQTDTIEGRENIANPKIIGSQYTITGT